MAIRLVLLVLFAASSAAAQVPRTTDGASGQTGIDTKPALPFSRLFATPLQLPPQVSPGPSSRVDAAAHGPRRKVVCGMTLLIVGSEPDPRMVTPKPDRDTRFTMRRYDPPACGKEK
jgi:hypothetical protein